MKTKGHPTPPRLPLRFLSAILRRDLLEEVAGDLEERFWDDLEKHSLFRARARYWFEALNYMRPFAIQKNRSPINQVDMFRNYLTIGWRSLKSRKSYSLINVGGLTLGVAAFLLLFCYVKFERSYEDFHTNADNIYRITLDLYKGSEYLMTDCEMYAPVGPIAKQTIPEVIDFVRMMNNDNTRVKVGDELFLEEKSYFADSSAVTIFTYQALHGNLARALSKPYQAVLTQRTAQRYFDKTDAVGETFEAEGGTYIVSSVIEDLPANTHLKFDFLLSHVTIPKLHSYYTDESWDSGNNEYTYLLMRPGTDLGEFNRKLSELSRAHKDKVNEDRIVAEPMKDIHLYSRKTYEPDVNGNARVTNALMLVAFFILGLAWVNYVNLSTGKAVERAKEVGVRKVMGSSHGQLVFQFLTESFLINLAAVLFALMMIWTALPLFRELSGQPLPDPFRSTSFWYWTIAIFVAGIAFSGGYPAVVLSSFRPIQVLKGKFRASGHGQWLRKALVISQFTITTILVIGITVVLMQLRHLRKMDLGMDLDKTVVLPAPQGDSTYQGAFSFFQAALLSNPSIEVVSQAQAVPGASMHEVSTTQNVHRVDADKTGGSFNYYHYGVDAHFIDAFRMQLLAGRNFEHDKANHDQVIINEEAVHALGFESIESAIGAMITYRTRWDAPGSTVVGVVKNFYHRSPKENKVPMILRYSTNPTYIVLRTSTDDVRQMLDHVEAQWASSFKSMPFTYFFLDEKYYEQYKADAQLATVVITFSVLAMVIACLGLFGLSSYTILQRTKEIGVRKVLGGTLSDIVILLSGGFMRLICMAGLIAIPVAYLLMNEWLTSYANRIPIHPLMVIVPFTVVVMVAMLTISIQTVRAAAANPVESLRTE